MRRSRSGRRGLPPGARRLADRPGSAHRRARRADRRRRGRTARPRSSERADGARASSAQDLDSRRPRAERREVRFERPGVLLDEHRRARAPRERLETDRAAAREEVEDAAPGDRVLQDVEERLAGARRTWAAPPRAPRGAAPSTPGEDADVRGWRGSGGSGSLGRRELETQLFDLHELGVGLVHSRDLDEPLLLLERGRTRNIAPSNRFRRVPGGSTSGVKRDAGASGFVKTVFRPSRAERSAAASAESAESSSNRMRLDGTVLARAVTLGTARRSRRSARCAGLPADLQTSGRAK